MNRVIFLLIFLGFYSCVTTPETIDISKFGYKFQHHIKNKGPLPHFKDTVLFHVALVKNGVTTHDTRKVGKTAQMIMRDYSIVTEPSPIEVALLGMTVGDSMTIFSKFSTDTSTIRYDISLIDIKISQSDKQK